jgi:predicted ATP-dependent serine protease
MIKYRCRACKGPPVSEAKSGGWIERGRAMGPCPNCGGFYRVEEVRVRGEDDDGTDFDPMVVGDGKVVSFGDAQRMTAEANRDAVQRIATGWDGVDYVFGGGIKTRAVQLLGGGEGAGKSTFIIELFRQLAKRKVKTLYINAEQGMEALCEQHERLGNLDAKYQLLLCESRLSRILKALEREEPDVAALDSLHAVEEVSDSEGIPFATGSDSAVGQIGRDLKRFVDETRCAMFAIGHLNIDGSMAGGRMLRYIVDGKLILRKGRNHADPMRYLQTDGKLRHGNAGRRCRLKMLDTGMVDMGPLPFGFDIETDGQRPEGME